MKLCSGAIKENEFEFGLSLLFNDIDRLKKFKWFFDSVFACIWGLKGNNGLFIYFVDLGLFGEKLSRFESIIPQIKEIAELAFQVMKYLKLPI